MTETITAPNQLPGIKRISPMSLESVGAELRAWGDADMATSTSWGTANLSIWVPFINDEDLLVKLGGWFNGAAVSGDVDLGVYRSSDWKLMLSTGATLQAGTTAFQTVDITDVWLPRGHYNMAMSLSSATGRIQMSPVATSREAITYGVQRQLTAHPLPDPGVPLIGGTAVVGVPHMFISGETVG